MIENPLARQPVPLQPFPAAKAQRHPALTLLSLTQRRRVRNWASDADLLVDDNGNHAPGRHRYQFILFGSQ
jgi:hypothetical protein